MYQTYGAFSLIVVKRITKKGPFPAQGLKLRFWQVAGGRWQVGGGRWQVGGSFCFIRFFFKRVCGEKMLPVGGGWGEIKIKRKYIKNNTNTCEITFAQNC